MGPVTTMSLSLKRQVKLVRQRQAGHRQPHSLGFFQSNSHVLDEVLDEESGIEISLDDPRSKV